MRLGVRRRCRRRPAPRRARRRPSAATSGAVKRVALLVTMPQGSACSPQRTRAPAPSRRRRASRASCAPRSAARNSSRSAAKPASSGASPNAAPTMPRAPEPTIGRKCSKRQRRQAALDAHLVAGAGQVGRAVDQRAVEVEQHRAARRHRARPSCRLAAREQVVDAGVGRQPVAPRQRVVFHAARVAQVERRRRGTSAASSLGRMNLRVLVRALGQQLAARTRRRRSRTRTPWRCG